MKWWGWGSKDREYGLKNKEKLLDYLKDLLDLDLTEYPPIDFKDIQLPKLTISDNKIDKIKTLAESYTSKEERLIHSYGKSYKDLIRIRKGDIEYAPDIICYPKATSEVQDIIKFAKDNTLKIVPFGGGTSVVGGVETTCEGTICMDLKKLDKLFYIDKNSHIASVQAGILGPDLEEELNEEGFTLGHYPQSFEYSTLGGWIATRGAGQNSTKYGKIEDMVEALTMCYPNGKISTKIIPASASGSDIKQILIGSEGTLGIITDAIIKLHPIPEEKHYCGFLLKNFEDGSDSLKYLMQNGITPSVARLSDPQETKSMIKIGSSESQGLISNLAKGIIKKYISKKGYTGDDACMMILGFEGLKDEVEFKLKQAKKIIPGFYLGTTPGDHWYKNRFELPYLRDDLIDIGMLVDTLETATNWDNIPKLYGHITKNIQNAIGSYGVNGMVQAHISHIYKEGAALYYTFVAKAIPGKEIEQLETIKDAAMKAIVLNGGTISHHHGIGLDHAKWLECEHGKEGKEVLKVLKQHFDPQNVLNPQKMGV
ncbi:MAG: FAD-binding oxidoreductase [Nanoarchaeota archaeon]|nr:FAD-binding oxidoreductase [Nanoarchaeota archaeon]